MRLRYSPTPCGSLRFPAEWYLLRICLTIGLVALLAGCSSVPDAINPVEWYKEAKSVIDSQDGVDTKQPVEKPASDLVAARKKPAPGVDEAFPSLGSVPERPTKSSSIERKRIVEGLVSDRESTRQYSKEVIRRQDEAKTALPLSGKAAAAPTKVSRLLAQPTMSQTKPIKKPPPRPKVEAKVTQLPTIKQPMPRPKVERVLTQERKFKIPSQNLVVPELASRQLGIASGRSDGTQTIIVSGNGVETLSDWQPAFVNRTYAHTVVSGVRSLEEFNPFQAKGSYQVATILFANGSAKLKPRDKRILRQVAQQHKNMGGTLRVVGHASSRTRNLELVRRKLVNFEISAARADAVAKELLRLGARPSKIFVGALSDAMPKFKEYMPSGEAGNRRTEIFIDF